MNDDHHGVERACACLHLCAHIQTPGFTLVGRAPTHAPHTPCCQHIICWCTRKNRAQPANIVIRRRSEPNPLAPNDDVAGTILEQSRRRGALELWLLFFVSTSFFCHCEVHTRAREKLLNIFNSAHALSAVHKYGVCATGLLRVYI